MFFEDVVLWLLEYAESQSSDNESSGTIYVVNMILVFFRYSIFKHDNSLLNIALVKYLEEMLTQLPMTDKVRIPIEAYLFICCK